MSAIDIVTTAFWAWVGWSITPTLLGVSALLVWAWVMRKG